METVKIGMAELAVLKNPGVLITLGLGSCVGVAVYDPVNKIAGLAHVMLPESPKNKKVINEAKFADTALPALVNKIQLLGGNNRYLRAKIAGGAQMFVFKDKTDLMRIGEKNVIAVRNILKKLNIKLEAEHTGGNYGRSIEFYSETGKMLIKTIGHGLVEI
ncbi:MAG: chemotaxis protein CheD [Thermosediminibacterales bacterium]|nr:chemotaxis protein CheD [Thermosediminibacterales bacterium]